MTTPVYIPCNAPRAHPERSRLPPAIAHVEPIKPGTGHGPYEMCEPCLLNKLMYWNTFVEATPLPGSEAQVAQVVADAAAWRRGDVAGSQSGHGRSTVARSNESYAQEVDDMADAATAEAPAAGRKAAGEYERTSYKVGDVLVSDYKGGGYEGVVFEDADGVGFRITKANDAKLIGNVYTTPGVFAKSLAGYAITNRLFWHLEGDAPAQRAPRAPRAAAAAKPAAKAAPAKKAAAKKAPAKAKAPTAKKPASIAKAREAKEATA